MSQTFSIAHFRFPCTHVSPASGDGAQAHSSLCPETAGSTLCATVDPSPAERCNARRKRVQLYTPLLHSCLHHAPAASTSDPIRHRLRFSMHLAIHPSFSTRPTQPSPFVNSGRVYLPPSLPPEASGAPRSASRECLADPAF